MEKDAKKWLFKAEQDLDTSVYNFKGKRYDAAVFYAHQSAEKGLKSFQIDKLKRFDKIHNLMKLAESVNASKDVVGLCEIINPAYFVSRYPDVEEKYDEKEVADVINAAKGVLKWIKKGLKS
ncbi:hypothetical protein A3K63_05075 [Candidatus Micrarchaeota archaeon RBG_16_49_10]|nr:MAG: hypothetical protein A3K63_05075 [Candidatus Micrarchaeota archaeon RBG_16_49_10]